MQVFDDQHIIYSENLAQPMALGLADSEDKEVLSHFKPQAGFAWLGLVGLAALFSLAISPYLSVALVLFGAVGAVIQSATQKRQILIYDLQGLALERYEAFVNAFGSFFTADRLWLYEQRSVTTDWKRNAGATNLMKRRAAQTYLSGDPKIKTNLSIPCLKSGRDSFYFLPDLIVARIGGTLRSFRYSEFNFAAANEFFIEEEGVPPDAVVVGQTWKFVRKDGGPDRRFNNNRQIPKCKYQMVRFSFGDALSRVFSKSRLADAAAMETILRRMTEVIASLRIVNDLAALPSPPKT